MRRFFLGLLLLGLFSAVLGAVLTWPNRGSEVAGNSPTLAEFQTRVRVPPLSSIPNQASLTLAAEQIEHVMDETRDGMDHGPDTSGQAPPLLASSGPPPQSLSVGENLPEMAPPNSAGIIRHLIHPTPRPVDQNRHRSRHRAGTGGNSGRRREPTNDGSAENSRYHRPRPPICHLQAICHLRVICRPRSLLRPEWTGRRPKLKTIMRQTSATRPPRSPVRSSAFQSTTTRMPDPGRMHSRF